MATVTRSQAGQPAGSSAWYSVSAEDAVARLGVDPSVGRSSQEASAWLAEHGPNALPAEQPTHGWRRFIR